MTDSDFHYVHGTHSLEQERLSRLNSMLNPASLRAMDLRPGDRVLDVGSGLGQLTRMMARRVGRSGQVIAVERDPRQAARAVRLARDEGEENLVEWRPGDAVDLSLGDDEWGGFDVAHTRFVLEHVTDPAAVVRSMVRAVKPGGRIILEDDDHDVLRLSPEAPEVLELWRAYYLTYEHQGKNPYVGRHLVSLLHEAGAQAEIVNFGLATERQIEVGIDALRTWMHRPDADARAQLLDEVRRGHPSARRIPAGLRTLRERGQDLNDHLQTATADNRFVAMIYGLFDDRSRTIHLANAGFPHALLASQGNLVPVDAGGIPLGLWPGTTYTTQTLRVEPDDLLVMCSDGLMEARDDRGEVFEASRLRSAIGDLAGQSAEQIAGGLTQAAIDFAGGDTRQEDDYTTVVLKFL